MTVRVARPAPALSDDGEPPAVAHVPGSGTVPDRVRLARITGRGAEESERYGAPVTCALADGCALYDAGYFWEAHEIWEPLWMSCTPNGLERRLVEAVIAIANGCLKLRMGRPRAAARLFDGARTLLEGCAGHGGPVLGVDVDGLREALDRFARRVAGGGPECADAALGMRPELSVYLNP